MIYSMTAFARGELALTNMQLVCEIRSINHRYLDVNIYLSDLLKQFEMNIRDKIRKEIKRGKIDCNIRLQQIPNATISFNLNHSLLSALNQVNEEVMLALPSAKPMSVHDVLRFPGVMETSQIPTEELEKAVTTLIEKNLRQLINERKKEGEALLPFFEEKLEQIDGILNHVQKELPAILGASREKLLNRFQDASLQLNNERLEQEMVLFAQKIDVVEEIERASSHVKAIGTHLKTGGSIGRQLDFLLQELNREANTLGSKSVSQISTAASLQMKLLIEQMREQAQNIE